MVVVMRLTTEFAELAPCQPTPRSHCAAGSRVRGLALRAGSGLAVGHASPTAGRDELKVRVMRGNGLRCVCVPTCVTEEFGCGRNEPDTFSRSSARCVRLASPVDGPHMRRSSQTFAARLDFQQTVGEREHVTANRACASAIEARRQPVGFSSSLPTPKTHMACDAQQALGANETREPFSALMDGRAGRRTAGEAPAPAASCLGC